MLQVIRRGRLYDTSSSHPRWLGKTTANSQVEAVHVYQRSPSQAAPNRKHSVCIEGSVCLQPVNTWLSHHCSDVNRILATKRGCDMRKRVRACDQTLRQEESIKTSTRRQPLHAATGRRVNEAHRVKQQNEKQVNNTACDTQKEANKGKYQKVSKEE